MKITIAGSVYEYDGTKTPMSEALAIEGVYKRRYAEWQEDLSAGSAKAMCVLAWIILRRDGTTVPFDDILSGTFDFDLNEMLTSMAEAAAAEAEQAEAAEAGPTEPPDPAGTPGTGTGTSPSSPASSTSARGKSASSKSATSKP